MVGMLTMILQISFMFVLLSLLLITPAQSSRAAFEAPVEELDRIVAVVNDDVIVLSELENRIRSIKAHLRQNGTPVPPRAVLQKQVLERLILDRLQRQMAEQLGIRVDDESLNRTLQTMAERNGLGLRQFRDVLEKDGYNFAKFREQVRDEMLISQVQQRQVENRIHVSEREIDSFLATRAKQGNPEHQYRLGHILIAVSETASTAQIAAARERANEVLKRLRDGASFATQAVAVSDGQQGLQGGDLGWRKGVELPTLFADTVRAMEVGDIHGPLRSPSGFHIVTLVDKRGDGRHIVTQTHTRHILIRTDELTSDAKAETQLSQLKERIEQGEDFAVLARSHSDDPSSAGKGGDLGWVSGGDMVPAFEEVMDNLDAGQISDPFRTPFGWHIVEVLDRRKHDETESVRRAKAKEQIRQRKQEEELQNWVRQLRDEAYVQLRLVE